LVSKDLSQGADSKYINLPWWLNTPKKSYIEKTGFFLTQEAKSQNFSFFMNQLFLGAFCHLGKFTF
jgi:hypothetical protein